MHSKLSFSLDRSNAEHVAAAAKVALIAEARRAAARLRDSTPGADRIDARQALVAVLDALRITTGDNSRFYRLARLDVREILAERPAFERAYRVPPVSEAQYAGAVRLLAHLALHHDAGSARAAAQVLLGTYNCYRFHADLVDLCYLDYEHQAAAMAVILGRATLMCEPHELIANGQALFDQLCERWADLEVSQRYEHEYEAAGAAAI
jgi:hypothetical protein